MQLNKRNRLNFGKYDRSQSFDFFFDQDASLPDRPTCDVEFVSEIMRLLAARWREGTEDKKKKRTRDTSVAPNTQKRKRGRPPLASKQASSVPVVTSRGRGRPRKNEKGTSSKKKKRR